MGATAASAHQLPGCVVRNGSTVVKVCVWVCARKLATTNTNARPAVWHAPRVHVRGQVRTPTTHKHTHTHTTLRWIIGVNYSAPYLNRTTANDKGRNGESTTTMSSEGGQTFKVQTPLLYTAEKCIKCHRCDYAMARVRYPDSFMPYPHQTHTYKSTRSRSRSSWLEHV